MLKTKYSPESCARCCLAVIEYFKNVHAGHEIRLLFAEAP